MQFTDIAPSRLQNQHLSTPDFKTPAEVVKYMGAVQAQDFAAAKWSVGLRMEHATDALVEQSFNEGKILRTHIMRPTWHFVMPEDIRWMLELTAPQIKRSLATYDKRLEITPELITRTHKIFTKALGNNNYLTRTELAAELHKNNILAHGQRLGHIVAHAEIDGVICSGPRRGKQFTYALIAERAPKSKPLSREESLAKLANMYFVSHGPAQIRDFAWWSGLNTKTATEALSFIKSSLNEEIIDGKTYWYSNQSQFLTEPFDKLRVNRFDRTQGKLSRSAPNHTAYLLSIFDEYTIAYNDRSALGTERYVEKFISMGNALLAVIILDGVIVGTWKRTFKKNTVHISLTLLQELNISQKQPIEKAVQKYAAFLEMEYELS